jgi:hypothetical protein
MNNSLSCYNFRLLCGLDCRDMVVESGLDIVNSSIPSSNSAQLPSVPSSLHSPWMEDYSSDCLPSTVVGPSLVMVARAQQKQAQLRDHQSIITVPTSWPAPCKHSSMAIDLVSAGASLLEQRCRPAGRRNARARVFLGGRSIVTVRNEGVNCA